MKPEPLDCSRDASGPAAIACGRPVGRERATRRPAWPSPRTRSTPRSARCRTTAVRRAGRLPHPTHASGCRARPAAEGTLGVVVGLDLRVQGLDPGRWVAARFGHLAGPFAELPGRGMLRRVGEDERLAGQYSGVTGTCLLAEQASGAFAQRPYRRSQRSGDVTHHHGGLCGLRQEAVSLGQVESLLAAPHGVGHLAAVGLHLSHGDQQPRPSGWVIGDQMQRLVVPADRFDWTELRGSRRAAAIHASPAATPDSSSTMAADPVTGQLAKPSRVAGWRPGRPQMRGARRFGCAGGCPRRSRRGPGRARSAADRCAPRPRPAGPR